ncbi:MAG: hypothetical protein QNJ97_16085 [Myxococcota bacterium]|nr:hypothetical protein [Myxococcota bacterium]
MPKGFVDRGDIVQCWVKKLAVLKYLTYFLVFAVVGWTGIFIIGFPDAQAASTSLDLPVHLRVARCGGQPVRPGSWVEAHVAAVQKIFSSYGIALVVFVDEFEPEKCELTTRTERHELARFVHPEEVVILVVKRVVDLDVPSHNLMGVNWRYRGKNEQLTGRRWIYLTARAKPPVLAHELGHFFGLKHDLAGGNLMTPGPTDPSRRGTGRQLAPFKPVLSHWQVKKLRRGIFKYLEGR